ncbi:MAG: HAMP domain-containing protein, partial [Planctomycetota bacterium]
MQKGKTTSQTSQSGVTKPGSNSKVIRPQASAKGGSALGGKPAAAKPSSDRSSKIMQAPTGLAQAQRENAPKTTHKGISLGIKYAILTALTVTLAVILLVVISYKSSSKVIDEDITEAGVRFVQGLATFDFSYWKSADKDTIELLASPKGERMGLNVPSVLNLVITDLDKHALTGIDVRSISLRNPQKLPLVTSENIEMLEGEYQEAITGKWVRTRLFIKKIIDSDLRGQGYVNLFLDARRIDEKLSDLLASFILPAILAIIIGGIIGFFMARWVTRPVKVLMEDMSIVSAGDLDHKSRVDSSDEVGILASSFDKMTDSLRVAHQRELETKALEHELNLAREIQYNLLPKEIPTAAGYDIAARYFPCFEVSGDYYD